MPIFQITGIKIDECKCRCAENTLIIQNQSTMKATLFHLHIHTHVVVGHSKRKIYRFCILRGTTAYMMRYANL